MRRIHGFLLALLVILYAPRDALAQTIKFDMMSPSSPAAGTISGQGSWSVGDHILVEVVLHAVNPKGGPGGQKACEIDLDKMTWNTQIAQLPTATYKVYARLIYRKSGSSTKYYLDTPLVDVPVK